MEVHLGNAGFKRSSPASICSADLLFRPQEEHSVIISRTGRIYEFQSKQTNRLNVPGQELVNMMGRAKLWQAVTVVRLFAKRRPSLTNPREKEERNKFGGIQFDQHNQGPILEDPQGMRLAPLKKQHVTKTILLNLVCWAETFTVLSTGAFRSSLPPSALFFSLRAENPKGSGSLSSSEVGGGFMAAMRGGGDSGCLRVFFEFIPAFLLHSNSLA